MEMSAREMLARMIRCEAEDQGQDGMKAVGTTMMERVHISYGEYLRTGQGDLRRILLQPYQFTCSMDVVGGQYNPQNIFNMSARPLDYEMADWVLSGNIFPGAADTLWYMNPFSAACPPYFPYNRTGVIFNRIHDHCFFQPTALYADT